MFRLEITQGPRGTCTFALHEGGRARLVSPEYADHERCVDAVRRLIYALRGDAESELLAELERDAPLLGDLYITLMQRLGMDAESFSNASRNMNQLFS